MKTNYSSDSATGGSGDFDGGGSKRRPGDWGNCLASVWVENSRDTVSG